MKIAITGHTKNLGLILFKHFTDAGHKVVGFSRSNGYKIPDSINTICEQVKEYDLFINNVHHDISQSIFLEKLYRILPIVTVGSIAANFAYLSESNYGMQKLMVHETHFRLKKLTENPMLLLKLGYLPNYPHKKPLSYQSVINAIEFWLLNPRLSLVEFENHPEVYNKVVAVESFSTHG